MIDGKTRKGRLTAYGLAMVIAGAVQLLLGGGCSSDDELQPLAPSQFYATTAPHDHAQTADKPQPVVDRANIEEPSPIPVLPEAPALLPDISLAPAITTPAPATHPGPGLSSGTYLVLGTIVAEVNGRPIYANKVLSIIEEPLHRKARDLEPAAFRNFARGQIDKEVQELIRDEMDYAAADRLLEREDKRMADAMTQKWRDDRITDAGGSLEIAKANAARDGADFEEQALREYRTNLIRIYIFRKLEPRVQISAQDLRDYYARHPTEFSERDSAVFRVIKIDWSRVGNKEQAFTKIKDIYDRAKKGADFPSLAGEENQEKSLKENCGLMDSKPIQKGSLKFEKLEEAIWNTPEGQLTDIMSDGQAFYFALVEKLNHGKATPFEDEKTQKAIHEKLAAMQRATMLEATHASMMKNSLVRVDPTNIEMALDMAMQKYAIWRRN